MKAIITDTNIATDVSMKFCNDFFIIGIQYDSITESYQFQIIRILKK